VQALLRATAAARRSPAAARAFSSNQLDALAGWESEFARAFVLRPG
jgi:hypothetical protein